MSPKPYSTNLTDAQWALLAPFFPPVLREDGRNGRPRTYSYRAILNGIFYVLRTGCAWEMLPRDLPPHATCYHYFRKWSKNGLWRKMHDTLLAQDRERAGRNALPTAAVLDSQSVKTTQKRGQSGTDDIGFDKHKNVKGRKRHLLVDTDGRVLGVFVSAADQNDRDGAKAVLDANRERLPKLAKLWADGSYTGALVDWVKERFDADLEIVKRSDDVKGFVVLPRRWVVERTFAWLGRYRRLRSDYELLPQHGESLVYIAMIRLMLNRLAT